MPQTIPTRPPLLRPCEGRGHRPQGEEQHAPAATEDCRASHARLGGRSRRPADHGRQRVPGRRGRLGGAGAGARNVLGGTERQQQLADHCSADAESVGDGRRRRLEVPVLARRRRHLRGRAGDRGPVGDGRRLAVAGGQHDGALPRGRQLGQLLPRRDHEHDAEPGVGRRRDRDPAGEHDRSECRRRAADRHGRGSGDRDDRDDRHARSGLAGSERDADRSACERARGRGRRRGDGVLQHDRAPDRHERPGGDVGDAGDDAAAQLGDRGRARGGSGRHAAPAREHDRPRGRRRCSSSTRARTPSW